MNIDLLNENLESFEIYEGVNANEVLEEGFIEEMANISTDVLVDSVIDFGEGGDFDEQDHT